MSTSYDQKCDTDLFLESIEICGGKSNIGHIIARLGWESKKILHIAKVCSKEISVENRNNLIVFKNSQFRRHERFQREHAFRRICGTEGMIHTYRYGWVNARRNF